MLSKVNFLRDRFAFQSYIDSGVVRPVHLFLIFTLFLCLAPTASAQHYQQTNLVSDIKGLAKTTDPNLVNAWGLTSSSGSPWWVANNGTGTSTLYNGDGVPFPISNPLVVTIPLPMGQTGTAAPTGIVFNGSSDFQVKTNDPARFIFVTEEGTISGWNPTADPTNAILKVGPSSSAVYKGATLGQMGGANFLYVANFRGGSVDVFDGTFNPVVMPSGAFNDPHLPSGFAPFNVQNINGMIFVSFAKQDADKKDEVAGPGLGFVDVFDTTGNWLMRLKHGRWLNAPWGLALAPADFGKFSNDILVGNFGSGRIAAFSPKHGNFRGLLRGHHGLPITIDGLWALRFGNGANAGPVNTLFFTAGLDDESHGLFGTLMPMPKKDGEKDDDNQDSTDSD